MVKGVEMAVEQTLGLQTLFKKRLILCGTKATDSVSALRKHNQ